MLEHFIYELASPLGTDEIKEKQMKKGMKNLSELLLNSGEDGVSVTKVKFPASEPTQVNAFMKRTRKTPFIYHPKKDVYRFHDVFVERAARKWEEERNELEAMEELKNQRWWKRSKSGRKGAGGGGRVEDLP